MPRQKTLWKIESIRPKKDYKELTLTSSGISEKSVINLSRFTYVSNDQRYSDTFHIRRRNGKILEIKKVAERSCKKNGECKLYPYFEQQHKLGNGISLTIKEITDTTELAEVRKLAKHHYIGKENLWGRKHYLIAKIRSEGYEEIVGYLLLNSAPLLSSLRNKILGWNESLQRRNGINGVVRIARVVVHPERRGMGIGIKLTKAAITYCEEYWNVLGKAPFILETVAEMGKFHPIFTKAGMHLIGNTKGNETVFYRENVKNGQGKGHFRASIDREKLKTRKPKPYYAIGLVPEIEAKVKEFEVKEKKNKAVTRQKRTNAPHLVVISGEISYSTDDFWSPAIENLNTIVETQKTFLKLQIQLLESLIKRSEDLNENIGACLNESKIHGESYDLNDIEATFYNIENEIDKFNSHLTEHCHHIKKNLDLIGKEEHSFAIEKIENNRTEAKKLTAKIVSALEERIQNGDGSYSEKVAYSKIRETVKSVHDIYLNVPLSNGEKEIQGAFGINPLSPVLVASGINLSIPPGAITLITGSSGSGKTSLLDVLSRRKVLSSGTVIPSNIQKSKGRLDIQNNPASSLVESFGRDGERAIELLNSVGLCEAHLYIKSSYDLSHGQKYRFAAAKLVDEEKAIWVADEFCSFLDPINSAFVSSTLSNIARETNRSLITATADSRKILDFLNPDVIIVLSGGEIKFPSPRFVSWQKKITAIGILETLSNLTQIDSLPSNEIKLLLSYGIIQEKVMPDKKELCLAPYGTAIMKSSNRKSSLLHIIWGFDSLMHF
ncbi:MAG: GNAT family N-acetyltransferase, partial [Thermoplasmata archaeon]|nr:GNAT family N-acetyltransferase [Thermoplasmata archaeon]